METYIIFQAFNHFDSDIVECRPISLWLRLPATVSWYLLTLIYYRILIFFVPERWLSNKTIVIPILLCVSILAGFFPLSWDFSVQRTLVYMIFFYLGYCTKDIDYSIFLKRLNLWMCIAILFCYYMFFYLSHIDISHISSAARTYYMIADYSYIMAMLIRLLVIVSALILSLCFMKLTVYIKDKPIITKIGQMTLLIYIYHIFFAKLYQHFNAVVNIPNGIIACVLYSLLTIMIIVFFSRLKLFTWVLNPISKTYMSVFKRK